MTGARVVEAAEVLAWESRLGEVLAACVESGASVSFLRPFTAADGVRFYVGLREEFAAGKRLLVGAFHEGQLVGSVQLVLQLPPNQPHRAEVAKLLVDPVARGRGVAQGLMEALEKAARERGKTLLVLDTVPGTAADRLYRRMGYVAVGEIPGFALMPDGTPCPTVIFYKRI